MHFANQSLFWLFTARIGVLLHCRKAIDITDFVMISISKRYGQTITWDFIRLPYA